MGKMGITFTNKEFMKLLENLPLDGKDLKYQYGYKEHIFLVLFVRISIAF